MLRVDDFDRAWDELDNDPGESALAGVHGPPVRTRPDKQNGERFAMLKEVFYLE